MIINENGGKIGKRNLIKKEKRERKNERIVIDQKKYQIKKETHVLP